MGHCRRVCLAIAVRYKRWGNWQDRIPEPRGGGEGTGGDEEMSND